MAGGSWRSGDFSSHFSLLGLLLDGSVAGAGDYFVAAGEEDAGAALLVAADSVSFVAAGASGARTRMRVLATSPLALRSPFKTTSATIESIAR